MGERVIYERDGTGKLTTEAKFEVERLSKEVVFREHKLTKAEKEEYEEFYVNLDPDYVYKRKGPQKLKWIEKAFKALLKANSVKSNSIYDIISNSKFIENIPDAQGRAIYELIYKNSGFFTEKQQKFLASPRFQLFNKHAVMTVLDSDEEDAGFAPKKRPLRDEEKTQAQLDAEAKERDRLNDIEMEMEEQREAKRRKRLDEEQEEINKRSVSRSRSRSYSPPPKSESESESEEKKTKKHVLTTILGRRFDIKPDGKPKVERRMDPTDGQMYSLAEYVAEYGGTELDPPQQWSANIASAFFFNE